MKLNDCLTSKVYLIVMILAILKSVIIYSVGRSHESKFEFHMPTISEWITIILLITILYMIGSVFLVMSVGDEIEKLIR